MSLYTMTKEENNRYSDIGKLREELPTMRRTRSLSELPGHLRVPILRRKDTERTQARLDAVAAGVKELRVLREKQQELMDQTIASAQQKRKQAPRYWHSRGDHHRLNQQEAMADLRKQMQSGSFSQLNSWHSVSSLASISEEWDSNSKALIKKNATEHFTETSDLDYQVQHHQKQQGCYQYHHNTENENQQSRQSQRHDKLQHHPHEKIIKTSIDNKEGLARMDNKRKAHNTELGNKTARSMSVHNDVPDSVLPIHGSQTRKHSRSQEHIPNEEHKRLNDLANSSQRQRAAFPHSDQFSSRGRSWSAHESSVNVQQPKRCASTSGQGTVENELITDSHKLHHKTDDSVSINFNHVKMCTRAGKNSDGNEEKNSSPSWSKHSKLFQQHRIGLPFNNIHSFSPQARAKCKSISWDNLLIAIGLQSESNNISDMEQDADEGGDEIFVNVAQASEKNAGHLNISDNEDGQIVQRKKMRSQSFTSGSSMNSGLTSEFFNRKGYVQCCGSAYGKDGMISHGGEMRLPSKSQDQNQYSSSLLRRASIQCETVITKTSRTTKIMNPLHDVDISSLQSPGPLHAVTLQYSNIPWRKPNDRNTISTASTNPDNEIKAVLSKSKVSPCSSGPTCSTATKHPLHTLQPIFENSHSSSSTLHVEQSKHKSSRENKELIHSKTNQQNTKAERPVPRPRKSISRALLSQQTNSNIASDASKSCAHHMTSEALNSYTSQENDTAPEQEDGNQMQRTAVLQMCLKSSNNVTVIQNEEPADLKKTDDVASSYSASQNEQPIIRHLVKDIILQHSRPSVPLHADSCSSVTESCKVSEQNTFDKQDLKNKKTWDPCVSGEISTSHLDCEFTVKKATHENSTKQSDRDVALQASSVPQLVHNLDTPIKEYNNKSVPSCASLSNFHTHDFSILSDEGYNTCDSISLQPHSISQEHQQFCDISPLSNRSIANINISLDHASSQKLSNDNQKQCTSPELGSSGSVKSEEKEKQTSLDTEMDGAKEKLGTDSLTGNKSTTSESKLDSRLLPDGITSASDNRSFLESKKIKQTKDNTHITITEQLDFTVNSESANNKDNDFSNKDMYLSDSDQNYKTETVVTRSVDLKYVSEMRHSSSSYHPKNKKAAIMEDHNHFTDKITAFSNKSNISIDKTDKIVSHTFKQTAV